MFKIYNEDCLMQLDKLEENSIDSIVTDPPYELNFMNKGWDNVGISFNKETWQKCLRVLKPGGYLLAFGGSRTYHRIAVAIEDAGFEIRDTIMWLYGSGFPKSMDISKQIDKKGGNDYSKQFAIDLKQARESRNLTMKYCDDKYCNSSTNWSWYEGRKDGCRVPDYNTYLEIVKDFPELEKYRELIKEAEREVIGKKESGCFNSQEKDRYTIGSSKSLEVDITVPSTDLAKQWQGWGTALKPSFEPIIVARKPFNRSCVDNVIEYGVGGINIDECRIPLEDEYIYKETNRQPRTENTVFDNNHSGFKSENNNTAVASPKGRFPANTILTYDDTDFEEVCGGFPDTKNSKRSFQNNKETVYTNTYTPKKAIYTEDNTYGDSGSASRYFYCAKASKKDRDEGLDGFEEKRTTDGCIRTNIESARKFGTNSAIRKNIHPTVKPTELMQYLIRLVTPNGGIVLDPFMGSGSTGKAVMYENKERNKNYKFIGIEKDKEYCEIAKARISYAEKQIIKEQEENEVDQISLF